MKLAHAPLTMASLIAVLLLVSGCMSYPSDKVGSNFNFKASLDGRHEVPPNDSTAGGYLTAQYSKETHILKWRLVVSGLSSPMTRGYFHGPDLLDQDATLVEIIPPFNGNEHNGGTTLTEKQAAELFGGLWYLDLQTEKFPAGEIRGQVLKAR
jgi:hypothetical protein